MSLLSVNLWIYTFEDEIEIYEGSSRTKWNGWNDFLLLTVKSNGAIGCSARIFRHAFIAPVILRLKHMDIFTYEKTAYYIHGSGWLTRAREWSVKSGGK